MSDIFVGGKPLHAEADNALSLWGLHSSFNVCNRVAEGGQRVKLGGSMAVRAIQFQDGATRRAGQFSSLTESQVL